MVEEFKFGNCQKCGKEAVTALNAGKTPLCAEHYVEQEDENCLISRLKLGISETGKVDELIEIQEAINFFRPQIYEKLKPHFQI